jgi:hypothetical protein
MRSNANCTSSPSPLRAAPSLDEIRRNRLAGIHQDEPMGGEDR